MSRDFIKEFKDRGYFYQCTNLDGLISLMNTSSITGYCGFDCTASSLHIGNLLTIMILRMLQKYGHKPIALVGGGTTKIGDPSGRDDVRKILSDDDILVNINSIKSQLSRFIDFNSENKAMIVNNADWLDDINYTSFLKDYGKFFSVNRMLSFDSVKLRLQREQHLSFLEFNYMLLQAYDFIELSKNYNCRLQIGGSDQWGNIVNGVELAGKLKLPELFGLTNLLITKSDGSKMGKSVDGAIWLDEDLLSVYDYYQYWRNTADDDVVRFLKLYTDIDLPEIDKLALLKGNELNEAKKILAFEATRICHGDEKAIIASESAIKLFEENVIEENLPSLKLSFSDITNGINIVDILVKSGLVSSKGEARRLIEGRGAKINNNIVTNDSVTITKLDMIGNNIKLSSGKKNHVIIRIE